MSKRTEKVADLVRRELADILQNKLRDPRVGFVSLGCPKALVDSEQILTQLRAEGYAIAPDYGGADLVVVGSRKPSPAGRLR